MHEILHAILHAVLDTAKIFVIIYLVYFLVELFENKFSRKIEKHNKKWSPLFGAGFGLVPQCGFSVVATDLYSKKHITAGTLIAIYISTSDEALPILLSSPDKFLSVFPLLICKFVIAVVAGFIVDGVLARKASKVFSHAENCVEHHDEVHLGCCHHEIEDEHKKSHWAKSYLLHPLIHSLKICAYILLFNIIFELLIHFVGEDNIVEFLQNAGAFAPLFAVLVGLIPNCVGSVVITNLYILGGISFGATLGGLIANAGIAYMILFKQNKDLKANVGILLTVSLIGLAIGYALNWAF